MGFVRNGVCAAAVLGCGACGDGGAGDSAGDAGGGLERRRPNVVVVLLDTLRPDHLELYGYPHTTAPFLSSVGARSVVFEAAYSSSSWTAPATASVFTGLYPDRHGVQVGLTIAGTVDASEDARPVRRIARRTAVLPEVFQEHGYRTLCVANNPNIHRGLGFGRGFDEFRADYDLDAGALLDVVRGWMSAHDPEEPFLLYVHLNDVHMPYDERPPWSRGGGDDDPEVRYDSEIGYVDAELRELFEHFGFLERDIVVVLSDHGEEFGEHGGEGHSFQLYDELQRVVMTWHWPGDAFVPARIRENVSLVDVLPTLIDLLGWPALPELDGRSLAGLLRGGDSGLGERPLFAHRATYRDAQDLHAVILGPWKLIDPPAGPPELYHLERDPREQRDLAGSQPERVADLLALLDDWRARDPGPRGREIQVQVDAELEHELRELGYVGDD